MARNKRSYDELKKQYNGLLEENGNCMRIVHFSREGIGNRSKALLKLSNGLVLHHPDIGQFLSKIIMEGSKHHIDILYSTDISEEEKQILKKKIKSDMSARGGNACVVKHYAALCRNMNYAGKENTWNKGMDMKAHGYTQWAVGHTKDTHPGLMKISLGRLGKNNPVHKQSQETKLNTRKKQSETMKKLIFEGKFTPNTHNSNTHNTSKVNGRSFRSSWEAIFWYKHQNFEYETIRIQYEWSDGTVHSYIVDFFDKENNILYEVKPIEHLEDVQTKLKIEAGKSFAENNGYKYVIISQHQIKELVDTMLEDDWLNFDTNSVGNLRIIKA